MMDKKLQMLKCIQYSIQYTAKDKNQFKKVIHISLCISLF